MTRFFSEVEIKKFDKKLNEDLLNSNERFKQELKGAIDEENHRSNVDRAKKKAVTQYMDYDNFHQMVLGADLKGMKLDDVIEIKPEKGILNPISEEKEIESKKIDIFFKNFVVDNQKEGIKFVEDDKLTLQKFKTKWKEFKESDDKINYLCEKLSNDDFYNLINVPSLDADLFSDLILNIGIVLSKNQEKNNKNEFLIKCLESIQKCSYYDKLKMFIGKKQKKPYEELIQNPKFIEEIEGFKNIIDKILKK
jgi:hypothetical protein